LDTAEELGAPGVVFAAGEEVPLPCLLGGTVRFAAAVGAAAGFLPGVAASLTPLLPAIAVLPAGRRAAGAGSLGFAASGFLAAEVGRLVKVPTFVPGADFDVVAFFLEAAAASAATAAPPATAAAAPAATTATVSWVLSSCVSTATSGAASAVFSGSVLAS